MEDKNHCGNCCSKGGVCDMHGAGFGCVNKIFFLRWFFGLAIIIIVFCLGVQLGELRNEFGIGSFGSYRGGMKVMMFNPTAGYSTLPGDNINY